MTTVSLSQTRTTVRLDTAQLRAVERHAAELARETGHAHSLSAALRDLIDRGLAAAHGANHDAAVAGYREGFLRAYGERREALAAALHGLSASDRRSGR